MGFSNEQMMEAISREGIVKESANTIKKACMDLQSKTNCPDEDIDDLLNFLVGRWNND